MKVGSNKFRKSKLAQRGEGFTIVELLVSIAIIGLLSVVMLANYRYGQRNKDLKGAAANMVSVLRRAQTAALSGLDYNNTVTKGYHVYIDTATNTTYQSCAELKNDTNGTYCANGRTFETINMPSGVVISSINLVGTGGTAKADVNFTLPYGDVVLNGDGFANNNSQTLQIVLTNTADSRSTTITVDPISGRILTQ